ncbi:DUF1080 domain-containing protein [Luteolibacter algae]|uniref:DUF1080 domain-containing protein n=1 Tax=Luteolibacter algae TaxID=454151 RepID=A0ABW5D7N8_9BACT
MKYLLLIALILPAFGAEPNVISEKEKAEGWQLLFNGKDLKNWQLFNSDKGPGPGWIIEDGILTKQKGKFGGSIVTSEKFENYILEWEWKISPKGNNGVKYLVDDKRPGAPGPEYQMLDDSNHPEKRKGEKRLTAALYDIRPAAADKKLKPAGEWNTSKIVVKGKRVEHWLNGELALDYELGSPELLAEIQNSKFKNAAGFGEKTTGRIMLTDHGDTCSYRNIKLLPIQPE